MEIVEILDFVKMLYFVTCRILFSGDFLFCTAIIYYIQLMSIKFEIILRFKLQI